MSRLTVQLDQERVAFEPGDEVVGTAAWSLDAEPRLMQLRLFWFTRGKGTEDVGIVETVPFDRPLVQDSRPFRLRLPEAPYSFSGKLISLVWALELVAEPSREMARVEIVMAPGGEEVRLDSLPKSAVGKPFFAFSRR